MTQAQYPIGGYAPGNYYSKCVDCGNQFQGAKKSFQCEPCAIKDKKLYDALTPEQRERFDNMGRQILKSFFEGRDKDAKIEILRKALKEIENYSSNDSWEEDVDKIVSIATEALKQV